VTLAPKGLLIEEQRTNLLTYSEQFNDAVWLKTAATVTANTVASPDGTVTADKIVEDTSTGAHSVSRSGITVASGAAHTFTVYAKAAERNWIAIQFTGGVSAAHGAYFDVANGTVGTIINSPTATSITPVGNGWYRCSVSVLTTGTSLNIFTYLASANGTVSYTGNGTSGVQVWGAQLEAGAFATSYIPTVASQVTRAADIASMIGNNFARWYTQGAGTVFADTLGGVTFARMFTISDASISNQIFSEFGTASAQSVYTAGTFVVQQGTISAGANKVANGYATNNFGVSINGGTALSDTSGNLAASYTKLDIGQSWNGTVQLNGTIKRIAYYPRRLANTELQGITS
jgi:hypothetical protein